MKAPWLDAPMINSRTTKLMNSGAQQTPNAEASRIRKVTYSAFFLPMLQNRSKCCRYLAFVHKVNFMLLTIISLKCRLCFISKGRDQLRSELVKACRMLLLATFGDLPAEPRHTFCEFCRRDPRRSCDWTTYLSARTPNRRSPTRTPK